MNISPLVTLLVNHEAWYRERGKRHKRASLAIRAAILCLGVSAILSMAVGGAGSLTVVLGILAGAAFGADRTFGFTRNWVEFSLVELRLTSAIAKLEFLNGQGADDRALIAVFDEAVSAVNAEAATWQTDLNKSIEELRRMVPQSPENSSS